MVKKAISRRKAEFIDTMDRLPVTKLPEGPEWTYELKLDGYRLEAVRAGGETTLYSRRRNILNQKFPYIASALNFLPEDTVIDGELVAMGPDGRPNFNLLQNFRSAESPHHVLRLRRPRSQRQRPHHTPAVRAPQNSTFRHRALRASRVVGGFRPDRLPDAQLRSDPRFGRNRSQTRRRCVPARHENGSLVETPDQSRSGIRRRWVHTRNARSGCTDRRFLPRKRTSLRGVSRVE